MSAMGDRNIDKRDAKRRPGERSVGVADWQSANPELVIRAIATVGSTGGALRFGYSRDGGAYSIGVLGNGSPYTIWVKPSESLDDILLDIIENWDGDSSAAAPVPEPKKKR